MNKLFSLFAILLTIAFSSAQTIVGTDSALTPVQQAAYTDDTLAEAQTSFTADSANAITVATNEKDIQKKNVKNKKHDGNGGLLIAIGFGLGVLVLMFVSMSGH